MSEIEKLKILAYDLMVKIQNDQNQLQSIHNKIAELSQAIEVQNSSPKIVNDGH